MHIFKVQCIHDNDDMDTYTIIIEKKSCVWTFKLPQWWNNRFFMKRWLKFKHSNKITRVSKVQWQSFCMPGIYMYNYIYTDTIEKMLSTVLIAMNQIFK